MSDTTNITVHEAPPVVTVGGITFSESPGEIFEAIALAQAEMKAAIKDGANTFFKNSEGKASKYAKLDSVWAVIKESFSKRGVSIIQAPTTDGNKVSLTTILGHKSGAWMASTVTATAKDAGPQSVGSTITYMRRYGLSAMAGVVADEDDDGNEAQGNVKQPARAKDEDPKRQAYRTLQKALESSGTLKAATEVWVNSEELLRALPAAGLAQIVDIWRKRTNGSEPPAIEGVSYPASEEQAV